MNKNMLAVAVLATSLAGCTTGLAMKAMNGIGMCPPGAVHEANQVAALVGQLAVGDDARYLEGLQAERTLMLTLRSGEEVQARLYRTGHPRCRNMPTEQDFTPVLVNGQGLVVGIGEVAFHEFQRGAVRTQEVGAVEQPREPWTLTGMMKALPF